MDRQCTNKHTDEQKENMTISIYPQIVCLGYKNVMNTCKLKTLSNITPFPFKNMYSITSTLDNSDKLDCLRVNITIFIFFASILNEGKTLLVWKKFFLH